MPTKVDKPQSVFLVYFSVDDVDFWRPGTAEEGENGEPIKDLKGVYSDHAAATKAIEDYCAAFNTSLYKEKNVDPDEVDTIKLMQKSKDVWADESNLNKYEIVEYPLNGPLEGIELL